MSENDDRPAVTQTLGLRENIRPAARWRRWLAVAAGSMAAMALVAWVRANDSGAPRYVTQPVERNHLTVTVTATGNLQAINQVDVSSELSGIIETVEVDYNDSVRVGQVLARLDTDRLEAQVLESRALLQSAQAKMREAEATLAEKRLSLDRTRELVGNGLSAQSELDGAEAAFRRAEADLASATAQVSQAEATLNARRTDLEKTVIRSPISGVVLDRNVEPGQTVAASLQAPVLFTLAEDLKQMELHVAIDEADVGSVAEGQEATFSVDAHPDRAFPATITQLRYAPQTVEGVVTYEALLRVDNADLLLRPGMTATAEIVVVTVEDATLVPNAALRFEPPNLNREAPTRRSGGLLGAILPRPPRQQRKTPSSKKPGEQQVWTLQEGQPVAVSIVTGATDGRMSEVVAGKVRPGLELLVGMESGG